MQIFFVDCKYFIIRFFFKFGCSCAVLYKYFVRFLVACFLSVFLSVLLSFSLARFRVFRRTGMLPFFDRSIGLFHSYVKHTTFKINRAEIFTRRAATNFIRYNIFCVPCVFFFLFSAFVAGYVRALGCEDLHHSKNYTPYKVM